MCYHLCKQTDCINWPVASIGIESCLRKQNRIIEMLHAKPKVFGSKFYAGEK